MLCCPNCFDHKWLKQHTAETSKNTGQCECCGEENVPVIEAGDLSGLFHNLLSMYVVAESYETGEPLIWLIQWRWQLFNEDVLNEDSQVELLEDIANSDWDDDDGEPELDGRELYQSLGGSLHYTHRDRWEEFCDQVRENPEEKLPFEDYFAEDFAQLAVTLPTGTPFYRARRGFNPGEYGDRQPFQGDEVGAPPPQKAHAGRASVEGQRVLYCADQEATAVAEVRPARGHYVSIANVRLNREARILDLAQEPEEINPFITNTLKWDVEIQSLLRAFAEEMSRPLERDDDPHHYLPCQRLADYIRDAHYDGVRYPSALSPEGTNVIFFDPGVADVGESKLVRIAETSLKYEEERVRSVAQQLEDAVEEAAPRLIPMMMLCHEHDEDPEMRSKPIRPEKREEVIVHMAAGLLGAYSYFREHRQVSPGAHRSEPRHSVPSLGGNDPWSCGSGKKYKRCCGGATVN